MPDLHNTKMLYYYKNYIDNKLPNYITSMFDKIEYHKAPNPPRTKLYENTIRFELHNYLLTAPNYFIILLNTVSLSCLKYNTKKYILERYSTLCTVTGCQVCHQAYIQRCWSIVPSMRVLKTNIAQSILYTYECVSPWPPEQATPRTPNHGVIIITLWSLV